jgi:5-methylcytosine-specific restriction protein A
MAKRIENYKPPHKLKVIVPQSRLEDNRFYKSKRWRALRLSVLREFPICQEKECNQPSHHVHHRLPRKEHPELAYDRSNLEALCQPCHNAKEVR